MSSSSVKSFADSGSQKARNNGSQKLPVRTLECTQSLRPKPFDRTNAPGKLWTQKLHKDELDIFLEGAVETLRTDRYNDIHVKCQLNKFERLHYETYKKVKTIEQLEAEAERQFRDTRRNEMLEKDRQLHATNTKFVEDMTERWRKTQQVKKDRRVRDLRYEMVVQRMDDLKRDIVRKEHSLQQKEGITEFEKIMKRSGIGAGDGGGGAALRVSYEDSHAFRDRLATEVARTMPTNEEVSDFKTQLKQRTTEKRAARYEKARRRRRALVDQKQNSHAAGEAAEEGRDDHQGDAHSAGARSRKSVVS